MPSATLSPSQPSKKLSRSPVPPVCVDDKLNVAPGDNELRAVFVGTGIVFEGTGSVLIAAIPRPAAATAAAPGSSGRGHGDAIGGRPPSCCMVFSALALGCGCTGACASACI